jgi:lipopolysaccharide export system permease protein
MAFAFIIVAFVGQARSTRSSRMESLVVAFLSAAMCRLGGLALNNIVSLKAGMVPMMYLLPVGAMLLSLIVIKGADHQRSGLAYIDKIVDGVALSAAKVSARITQLRSKSVVQR